MDLDLQTFMLKLAHCHYQYQSISEILEIPLWMEKCYSDIDSQVSLAKTSQAK